MHVQSEGSQFSTQWYLRYTASGLACGVHRTIIPSPSQGIMYLTAPDLTELTCAYSACVRHLYSHHIQVGSRHLTVLLIFVSMLLSGDWSHLRNSQAQTHFLYPASIYHVGHVFWICWGFRFFIMCPSNFSMSQFLEGGRMTRGEQALTPSSAELRWSLAETM